MTNSLQDVLALVAGLIAIWFLALCLRDLLETLGPDFDLEGTT